MQFDQASSEEHRRHTEAMLGTLNRQVRALKECEKRAAALEKELAVCLRAVELAAGYYVSDFKTFKNRLTLDTAVAGFLDQAREEADDERSNE